MANTLHLDLDRYVPGLLNFLSNKLSAGASKCYRERFGVGVVEWRMLSMLAVEEGITANRICQVIGLDKAAVSRSLQQLEKAGHVRSEVDANDGRRYVVSLTASGQALHDQIYQVAMERERLLLDALSEQEVDALISMLGRMHGQLEKVNALHLG